MGRDRYGEPVEHGEATTPSTPPRRAKAPPRWEVVPRGTKPSICTGHTRQGGSCRAEIFWIERPRIRDGQPVAGTIVKVPVSCAVEGGQRPNSIEDGRGLSHYTDCPDAPRF